MQIFVTPIWILHLIKNSMCILWSLWVIIVWIPSIHSFCDPIVDIAFDDEKPMHVLWTLWAIVIWIPSIHINFCDPNVGIAIEEGKSNVCFVNSMNYYSLNTFNPYKLFWPQCKYCIWGGKIHYVFCELYVSIVICIPSI